MAYGRLQSKPLLQADVVYYIPDPCRLYRGRQVDSRSIADDEHALADYRNYWAAASGQQAR